MMQVGPVLTLDVQSGLAASAAQAARKKSAGMQQLEKAAGDFEAMLLNSLWGSMKGLFDDDDSDSGADPILKGFDDWGTQALSQAAGGSGALGFKSLILKHLTPLVEAGNSGSA
jgi:Rod binding domain-containing protein